MSDAREALVALILERFRAAETYMDLPRQAGLLADAIQAAGWTPPGEGDDAELRAEVERLRGVERGWQHDRSEWESERNAALARATSAEQGRDEVRALAAEMLTAFTEPGYPGVASHRTGWVKDTTLARWRDLLAESGEQPGKGERTRAGFRYCETCRVRVDDEHGHDRPAPAVPDSADVRGELLHVLDSHGIDTYIDGTGAEVGVQNLITDILAAVGQGVTADIPERLRRAVARLEEKRDDLRKPDMFERARLNGKIEGVKLASSYIDEGERIFRAAVRPDGQEGS